ncbi:DNA-directed RNA polymerase subunit delta [Fictibacillus barbaricus]|uniref:Probable DNA-directed RNA polymerase subunit delta n=1 Tax=Fictibacillus barbaricus TaxID=182136 RepID=A0ABU1U309_9BACL|nr:DNA-directed RNA polymerase subunit delta [Fictibacillus barbaricus]MDR7073877.1 DNA-directed RNA polymerase subunit delta [Fictibacillus barbaricus]
MAILKTYTKEQVSEMSMVEIAFEILQDQKKPVQFYDLVKQITEIKGLTKTAVEARIAYFYTDMNIDGRFVSLGDNQWGLKTWYPVESSEEELGATNKPTKRKKASEDDYDFEEDFDDEDFDELDVEDEFVQEDDDLADDDSDDDDDDEELEFEDDDEDFDDEDDEDADEEEEEL